MSAIAQLLLRHGMKNVGEISSFADTPRMLLIALSNPTVLGGLAIFGFSALTWLIALSRVELSIAYPMVSLGYIFVIFFSWLVLKESVRPITVVGCFVIVLGVFLISRGMQQ